MNSEGHWQPEALPANQNEREQSLPRLPRRRIGAYWRQAYLVMFCVFFWIWHNSEWPIKRLQETRNIGGLHPVDVLLLRDALKLLWVLPLAATLLYAASFVVRRLNTAGAIALIGLIWMLLLAIIINLVFFHIGFGPKPIG